MKRVWSLELCLGLGLRVASAVLLSSFSGGGTCALTILPVRVRRQFNSHPNTSRTGHEPVWPSGKA